MLKLDPAKQGFGFHRRCQIRLATPVIHAAHGCWATVARDQTQTLTVMNTQGRRCAFLRDAQAMLGQDPTTGTPLDPIAKPFADAAWERTVVLFGMPAAADWSERANWHLANPGLKHGYPDLYGLRQLAREAEHKPADRDAFRQLHLNQWLDYSETPFVEMAIYDEGAGSVDLDEKEASQEPCWLAVDLSSNSDLTAVVAAWGDPDSGYDVAAWFFCPEDNLRRRAERDGVPYPTWAEYGFITPTPGNVVDFRAVEDHIRELCASFNVQEIAFDPHLGRVMMANLTEDGFPAVEMRQGWITMAPAIKELERAIIGRRFRHGGHPILRWHFANIAVNIDPAGNMKFDKKKSKDKIDGAQAIAMAVGRAAQGNSNRSSYDTFDGDVEEWAYA